MTRASAKKISHEALERRYRIHFGLPPARFAVVTGQVGGAVQNPVSLFFEIEHAMSWAERNGLTDYKLLELSSRGTVDLTPGVVRP